MLAEFFDNPIVFLCMFGAGIFLMYLYLNYRYKKEKKKRKQ